MTSEAAQQIARQLLAARRDRRPVAVPPASERPRDAAAAYEIQDAVLAGLGPIGAWKVGASSPNGEPTCAPLPQALVAAGPVCLPAAELGHLGIEAEIAFRISTDLPPRYAPYTREETIAAIGAAMPAIEVVDSRWIGWPRVDRLWQLADHGSNGMLVFGQGRSDWHGIDLGIEPVKLTVGDRIIAEAIGGNASGDVIRVVTWLANHAAARCGGLKAGDIVTTGSCTGMNFVHAGSTVRASFVGLGEVEVSFAA